MHRMRAADRRRRRLAEAEVAHLPLLHELRHRPDGLLDRHVVVDAMLIIEVDVVDAEPLERGVAGATHVLRGAVDAEAVALLVADVAELRGENDLVASALDRPTDEPLVGERAVHVGGVEEVDAEVERAVNGRDRRGFIAARVEVGHAHTAEAEGGDGQFGTEGAALHAMVLQWFETSINPRARLQVRRYLPRPMPSVRRHAHRSLTRCTDESS